ncbi:MAG: hypothetical protein H8D23_41150 [Candidatus Brocadiales bacterium]|nr:hypothetical protein [Candidatus Brocadiales bacterium]
MGITKKPKFVQVTWKEVKSYYSVYECPSCMGKFEGFVSGRNTLRFRCECGQELIVKEEQG